METQKERLSAFINASGLSVRAFERELGVATGTVRKINDVLSANMWDKISSKFPQLNRDHKEKNVLCCVSAFYVLSAF